MFSSQQVVRHWSEVNGSDLETNGIIVPDVITILIVTGAGVTCDLNVTMDDHDVIAAGNATFHTILQQQAGETIMRTYEFGPMGIQLVTSGAGVQAWVKG